MTLKGYLLASTSHDTIARIVPLTPAEHETIMDKIARAIWGKAWL